MSNTVLPPSITPSSHLDFALLLAPTFNPHHHAAHLIHKTLNPSDPPPIDLTTPLSRALFDAQEVDGHIHSLTSRSAVDILGYTKDRNESAQRVLDGVESEVAKLNSGFARLESEVVGRWSKAEHARRGAERGLVVLRLLRNVQRVTNLARSLEGAVQDSGLGQVGRSGREDHRALVRASQAVLGFREIMLGPEREELGRVNLVKALRGRIFEDSEEKVRDWARKQIREFNVSSFASAPSTAVGATFRDVEEARARFTSATHILYLLSPSPLINGTRIRKEDFEPELLIRALQGYVASAVQSSSAGIARGLGALPQLERALQEVSGRCQSVVGLEVMLGSIGAPQHPLVESPDDQDDQDADHGDANLLDPLLHALDTASLPSYFWRSLASGLGSRVQEVLSRGGVSARTLRSNRDLVAKEVRECVLKGSRMPGGLLDGKGGNVVGNWEREAAVMVGAAVGPLGR